MMSSLRHHEDDINYEKYKNVTYVIFITFICLMTPVKTENNLSQGSFVLCGDGAKGMHTHTPLCVNQSDLCKANELYPYLFPGWNVAT